MTTTSSLPETTGRPINRPLTLSKYAPPPVQHPSLDAFTCTFCWHNCSTKPHVLGRSARLVCRPCHDAILNLSICWQCGEMVFRGDDCVSLAWCFWHRSCYACLLCGSGNVVRGVKVRELFEDGEAGKAREVEEIPLCAQCFVETEAVISSGPTTVVENALRRMEYSDGGLARRRWENQHKGAGVTEKV